jgi:hypothetical protein
VFYCIYHYTSILEPSQLRLTKTLRFISYNLLLINVAVSLKNYNEKKKLAEFIQEFYERIDYVKYQN